jgi:hypothetical protein
MLPVRAGLREAHHYAETTLRQLRGGCVKAAVSWARWWARLPVSDSRTLCMDCLCS